MKKIKVLFIIFLSFFIFSKNVLAGPTSTNFELKSYGFGSGGTENSTSTNFKLFGTAGEVETSRSASTNFKSGNGLIYTIQANLPPAPTLTNPSSWYNKLKIVLDNGGNSTDSVFSIAISIDAFSSDINYIQNDNTVSTTPFYQTYSAWGGASGFNAIGLIPGTNYTVKADAKRGNYTQTGYGPVSATVATSNTTFTFSLETTSQPSPPFSVFIGNLTPGSVTTSSDKVTATISTNATNGGLIYLYGNNAGLKSSLAGNYNISSATNDLNSLLEGYGARGTTVTQSSGGPMQLISPYSGAGNNVGVIDTTERLYADSSSAPVTSGQASFELKAKASNTTPSATDYADLITVVATGSF